MRIVSIFNSKQKHDIYDACIKKGWSKNKVAKNYGVSSTTISRVLGEIVAYGGKTKSEANAVNKVAAPAPKTDYASVIRGAVGTGSDSLTPHWNEPTKAESKLSADAYRYGETFAEDFGSYGLTCAAIAAQHSTRSRKWTGTEVKQVMDEFLLSEIAMGKNVSREYHISESYIGSLTAPKTSVTKAPENTPAKAEPVQYVILPTNATFIYNGKPIAVDATTTVFSDVVLALMAGDVETAYSLCNTKKAIEHFMQGNVEVIDGQVTYKGIVINTTLTTRIIDAMSQGDTSKVSGLVAFFEHLMENPSFRAVQGLFDFLKAADIEITDDGYFYAWKKVRDNYRDIHSGKFDNSPGSVVAMPRNLVNENPDETCSEGLHVCSKSYLPHFGSCNGNRIVKVKVHPKDVVAVPRDYNDAKMRVCEYEVIEDVTELF